MQSMETAPRDGTRIIIHDNDDGQLHCAHWMDGVGWFIMMDPDEDDIEIVIDEPMGWLSMPASDEGGDD